jgi:hypothetical protein
MVQTIDDVINSYGIEVTRMKRIKPAWWIGIFGGLIGALIGLYVSLNAIGSGYELLPFTAGLAAFGCTAGTWWLLLDRNRKYSLWRGALAGGLAGIFAHYVCWYLMILAQNICYWGWGGCVSSLGDPPANPLIGFGGALVFSLWSLLLFGWLTIPIGVLAGGIYATWIRYRLSHPRIIEEIS